VKFSPFWGLTAVDAARGGDIRWRFRRARDTLGGTAFAVMRPDKGFF
jgi:hypothetical protein